MVLESPPGHVEIGMHAASLSKLAACKGIDVTEEKKALVTLSP